MLELLVSIISSGIILGALVSSAMSLRRGIHGTQVYAGAYAEQQRLQDFLSRDMRRAVMVTMSDEDGNTQPAGKKEATVRIEDRSSLVLQLPGFYANSNQMDADARLPVVGTAERLDYGTDEKLAEPVIVAFRKIFCASEGTVCFVREEDGVQQIIVRDAADLSVEVTLAGDAQSAAVRTWYRSKSTAAAPLVATYDFVLLRNLPPDYRP